MKLIFCVGQLDKPGGTEKVLANKANYFVNKLGYEVHIITIGQQEKTYFYKYDKKIFFHDIHYNPSKKKLFKPIQFYKNIQYFKKQYKLLFDKISPDIITVNERGYLDYIIPFIRKDIPKVREFHSSKKAISIHARQKNSWPKKIKHLLMYSTIYAMFNKYDYLVLLTQKDKNESNYKTNVTVIPNIHQPFIKNKTLLNNKNIITVGSMNGEIKRLNIQIDLWYDLVKEYPDWVLNVYGDGLNKEKYQKKINNLGLEKNVILHGTSNELHKHYLDSSIYLFTSIGEGLPMVLIEAMSYGVPCVSFDCPHGPSEIISNNIDGILVPNNDITQLKKSLIKLMSNDNLRKQMGEQAFKNSKRFLPSQIAPEWDKLYNKIKKNELN